MRSLGAVFLACMVFLSGCAFLDKIHHRTAPAPGTRRILPARRGQVPGPAPAARQAPAAKPPRAAASQPAAAPPRAPAPAPSLPEAAPSLGIPVASLPPPGACRVWVPEAAEAEQGPAGSCASLRKSVPAGGWLVYRSEERAAEVMVSVYRSRWPRTVAETRYFDFWTGRLLRVE